MASERMIFMSMTKFRTKPMAKARVFTPATRSHHPECLQPSTPSCQDWRALRTASLVAATSLSLLSCSSAPPPGLAVVDAGVQVISAAPPRYSGAVGDPLQYV